MSPSGTVLYPFNLCESMKFYQTKPKRMYKQFDYNLAEKINHDNGTEFRYLKDNNYIMNIVNCKELIQIGQRIKKKTVSFV